MIVKQSKYATCGNYKHGMKKTRLYSIWKSIRQRCRNPKFISYYNYGGRGIKVVKQWDDFMIFYKDMNDSYQAHLKIHGKVNTTIERINTNKNYSKKNCKWATRMEQANNIRKNKKITYQGETKTLAQWARTLGIRYGTLHQRFYKYKLGVEEAFTKKVL